MGWVPCESRSNPRSPLQYKGGQHYHPLWWFPCQLGERFDTWVQVCSGMNAGTDFNCILKIRTTRRRTYKLHSLRTRSAITLCVRYNPETGQGAIGVEFAGTAVTSSSSFGTNISPVNADIKSAKYVVVNPDLQWSEGSYRGFFTLIIEPNSVVANYYAMDNISESFYV